MPRRNRVVAVSVTEARRGFGRVLAVAEMGSIVQITRYRVPILYVLPTKLYKRWVSREAKQSAIPAAGKIPRPSKRGKTK